MVDSGHTPHLLIDAASEAVVVPREHVADGRIVLNISPTAVRGLEVANEVVRFDGRFSGRAFQVSAPMSSVMALYAKETGEGMMFSEDASAAPETPEASRGPALKLVT